MAKSNLIFVERKENLVMTNIIIGPEGNIIGKAWTIFELIAYLDSCAQHGEPMHAIYDNRTGKTTLLKGE